MSRQPLFPHIPGRKEAQFPHVPKGQEIGWVYAKVGITEVRGRKVPTGIDIEQVSPTYDQRDFDKAVKIIEEKLKGKAEAGTRIEGFHDHVGMQHILLKVEGRWYRYAERVLPDDLEARLTGYEPVRQSFLRTTRNTPLNKLPVITEKELRLKTSPTPALPKAEAGDFITQDTIDYLAKTEGNPIRKFCCRQCGECAPPDLLEEGRFPDRIAWLRSHYKAKHPGIWGKGAPKLEMSALREPEMSQAEIDALKYAARRRDFIAILPYGGQVEVMPLRSGKWRAYIRYFETPWSPRGQEAESGEVVRDGYGNIITGDSREDLISKLKSEYPGWKWGKGIEKLPQVTIEGGELIPPKYQYLRGWVSEPLPKEAD